MSEGTKQEGKIPRAKVLLIIFYIVVALGVIFVFSRITGKPQPIRVPKVDSGKVLRKRFIDEHAKDPISDSLKQEMRKNQIRGLPGRKEGEVIEAIKDISNKTRNLPDKKGK